MRYWWLSCLREGFLFHIVAWQTEVCMCIRVQGQKVCEHQRVLQWQKWWKIKTRQKRFAIAFIAIAYDHFRVIFWISNWLSICCRLAVHQLPIICQSAVDWLPIGCRSIVNWLSLLLYNIRIHVFLMINVKIKVWVRCCHLFQVSRWTRLSGTSWKRVWRNWIRKLNEVERMSPQYIMHLCSTVRKPESCS